MKNILITLLCACLLAGCALNLVTGRKQLSLVKESDLRLMAVSQYNTFLKDNKVLKLWSTEMQQWSTVSEQKLPMQLQSIITPEEKKSVLEGYSWEFNTIDDNKVINAWCMPGGKVVVYTGLLPVTQNETALAIVIGHEIAHSIAKHGNERMSQALVQQMGGMALEIALSQKPQETQDLFMTTYGIGSQLGAMLPWSRQQETEADQYGLIFSAMAGYDPREAIPFWKRMSEAGGGSPPEFLSTHPSDETRLRKLNQFMPEALKYYTGRKYR